MLILPSEWIMWICGSRCCSSHHCVSISGCQKLNGNDKKSQIKTTSSPCLWPGDGNLTAVDELFKYLHSGRVHTPLDMHCGSTPPHADRQTVGGMRGLMVRRKPRAGILTQKSTCFAGKCDKYSARPPLAAPPGCLPACAEGPHL